MLLVVLTLHIAQAKSTNKEITAHRLKRELPFSMDKEMFPPQEFDEEAPICMAEREPCGFYSFSLDGKAPLKWIKSWCRCSPKHECVYERTDLRMRVYRQTCVLKNLATRPNGIQQLQEEEQNFLDKEGENKTEEQQQNNKEAKDANSYRLDQKASEAIEAKEFLDSESTTTTMAHHRAENASEDNALPSPPHHHHRHNRHQHDRHIRKVNHHWRQDTVHRLHAAGIDQA